MCVDDVVRCGGALERMQIYILAKGLKIDSFGSLVQTFCESCEQLGITHPSIHMTWRFVIQFKVVLP